jgi:hypothetical protein
VGSQEVRSEYARVDLNEGQGVPPAKRVAQENHFPAHAVLA